MNIGNIQTANFSPQISEAKLQKKEEQKNAKVKDSAEISPEARALFETKNDAKLAEIAEKINSGFYSKQEVIEKAVEKMIKDIE